MKENWVYLVAGSRLSDIAAGMLNQAGYGVYLGNFSCSGEGGRGLVEAIANSEAGNAIIHVPTVNHADIARNQIDEVVAVVELGVKLGLLKPYNIVSQVTIRMYDDLERQGLLVVERTPAGVGEILESWRGRIKTR